MKISDFKVGESCIIIDRSTYSHPTIHDTKVIAIKRKYLYTDDGRKFCEFNGDTITSRYFLTTDYTIGTNDYLCKSIDSYAEYNSIFAMTRKCINALRDKRIYSFETIKQVYELLELDGEL